MTSDVTRKSHRRDTSQLTMMMMKLTVLMPTTADKARVFNVNSSNKLKLITFCVLYNFMNYSQNGLIWTGLIWTFGPKPSHRLNLDFRQK